MFMCLKTIKALFALQLIIFLCLPIPAHAQRIIKAGIDPSLPPFSFIDQSSGTIRGFNVDLIKLLSANLGAKIRFVPLEAHEMRKALSEGRVDLVVDSKGTGTDLPYLELPLQVEKRLFVNNCCVTVTCVKDLAGHMIVFQRGDNPAPLIPEKKDIRFMEAKTHEEVLQILDSGQATAFISSNSRATIYLIQKNQLKNIKEVGMPVETLPLAVFVGHDNTPLLTELSVGFGKIVENKNYETIYRKWFGHDIPFSDLARYLKIVGAAAGLFAIALSAVFFWNRTLKRKVRQVMTERKRLEEELIQSERLAIMGEMAAGVAHEINNPLGIILANAEELLQHKLEDEEMREGLKAVERNAVRAGKFIDDLLTFTRPTPPTKNRIDLVALVDESLALCKQQLRKKQILVEKEFPAEPLFLEGDDSQIQQVLINVFLNAVQAIPGKGFIRIRAGRSGNNGSEATHLEIADSGMGIPEKDLTRIFDPFYTARKNKGFGLGLSISKRIIEKHNGKVRIESTVGQGTTVFIDLPAALPPSEAAQFDRATRA